MGRSIVIKTLQEIALSNAGSGSQQQRYQQYQQQQLQQNPKAFGSRGSNRGGVGPRYSSVSGASRASPLAQQQVFAESSWCCLILLILGDLITGSADIMALRKTLVSFREGRKREGMGHGPLVEFLEYQSGLYELPLPNKTPPHPEDSN